MKDYRDRSNLSLTQRLVASLFDAATYSRMRSSLPFATKLIRQFGTKDAFRYFLLLGDVGPHAEKVLGEADGQLLIALSAMWNGCRFCALGHCLAANMVRFRDEGLMCPLTHVEMMRLQTQRDDAAMARIEEVLSAPEYDRTRKLAHRMYELEFGIAGVGTEHDKLLAGLLATWAWLSECSILAMDTSPHEIPPLSPVAKDKKTVEAYFEEFKRRFPDDAAGL